MTIYVFVKSAQKLRSLTDRARSLRAEIFKILGSVDMLVFSKLVSTHYYFVPKGMGHMFIDLGLVVLAMLLPRLTTAVF